ncbi:MAG: FtsX-like permease family protein [Prevotella sp.]|mgnify:CR=1 FL=1|nr:FtsX-like permease family protein [Prevotella sp.]MDD6842864.1 FtsX-like permease family protein [Prevotellaceae bacterium]MCI7045182.1 FtsX-like permease family protein [Prevotella sp.]MDD6977710.1 FtsX-like permease family protein [Prevotellaceae bacterium]MDY5125726.1 FtsX-like permease family protein [Prevotella sp.]
MNFSLFVAKRYLFSKKSTHVINIISAISAVGVAVATMAMVVTLSVFNGFHDLVATLFTAFDPQIEISPAKGKTMDANSPLLTDIKRMKEVSVATESVEDQALAIYEGRQAMVRIRGVQDNFDSLTHIREILMGDGEYMLKVADMDCGILGIRLAQTLGTGITFDSPLYVYAPKRQGQLNMANPTDGFVEGALYSPGVIFCVKQAKYDKNLILTNIAFARNLFDLEGKVTALSLRLKPGSDLDKVKAQIKEKVGSEMVVKDRFEQQEDTFRIMKIEKLIAYIFLTFILAVACFNIIGSLSMLIIDKRDDVKTLRNLGADDKLITRIFLMEGRMISTIGAVVGIALGLALCWAQQTFSIVGLGKSSGSFVVDAYPVSVHPWDIVLVFFTVIIVGYTAVWYPVRYFAKRLL